MATGSASNTQENPAGLDSEGEGRDYQGPGSVKLVSACLRGLKETLSTVIEIYLGTLYFA